MVISAELDGFLDLSAFQAFRTHLHALGAAFPLNFYRLEIEKHAPFAPVMRVTHLKGDAGTSMADFATLSHKGVTLAKPCL